MNAHELRLRLATEIKELVLDISWDENASDDEKIEIDQSAASFTEFLMDSLNMRVLAGNDHEMTISVSFTPSEP